MRSIYMITLIMSYSAQNCAPNSMRFVNIDSVLWKIQLLTATGFHEVKLGIHFLSSTGCQRCYSQQYNKMYYGQ